MKLITVLILLFTFSNLSAQKIHIKYLTNSGVIKERVEDADFIREYTEPDSGKMVGVREFYKNGNIKLIGQAIIENNSTIFTGDMITYDLNKNKIEYAKYNRGIKYFSNLYYKTGKLKQSIKYDYIEREYSFDLVGAITNEIPNVYFKLKPNLIYYADSLGNVMVNDGNGLVTQKQTYIDELYIEKGNYKNGFKRGLWEGAVSAGNKYFTEKFNNGKLISGKFEDNGIKFKYNKLYTAPFYGLGNNHIIEAYLEKINFKSYYANSAEVEKKYTSIKVYINEKGKIDRIELLDENPYLWIKQPLTKVLLNMPAWKPAVLRGQKVRSIYISNIPIYAQNKVLKTQTP